jgi:TM2 domain-containing membrane protein YozV
MSRKVTAIILSGLVLPGLGQFYLGRKIKGAILIGLVNIFLLAALAVVARGLGTLVLLSRGGDRISTDVILRTMQQNSPGARWLIILFCALWLYGIVDLLATREPPPPATEG